jgi:hypothetical protein|tara:strand:+ start:388 stop:741 length:354 start_codon:yes stop_codon:yes gene_type:complete
MSFLTRNHNQTAVYWGTPATDKFGSRTFADPVELSVRWEDRNDKFIDAGGREDVSRAFVFLGQDIDLGGFLFLGSLSDIDSSTDETKPENVDNSFEVKAFVKTPNLKATNFERKAIL